MPIKNRIKVLFVASSMLLGCKKETDGNDDIILAPQPACVESFTKSVTNNDSSFYDIANCGYITEVNVGRYNYYHPCYNPNDENQICYVREDSAAQGDSKYQLYVFDFCKNQVKSLGNCALRQPDWSTRNQIAYIGIDKVLYTIKPNGDSLIRYANISQTTQVKWHPKGDSLLLDVRDTLYVTDRQGHFIDTIGTGYGAWDWGRDSTINCAIDRKGEQFRYPSIGHLNRPSKVYLEDFPIYSKTMNTLRTSRNRNYYFILSDENRLYELNTVINRVSGQKRVYRSLTLSPDANNKNIIFERVDRIRVTPCIFQTRHYLTMIDFKAPNENERVITIPE